MTIFEKVVYLSKWEECVGRLSDIRDENGMLIVLIGKIRLMLPTTLDQSLRPLIGQKIAILRTDDQIRPYRYRIISQGIASEQAISSKE